MGGAEQKRLTEQYQQNKKWLEWGPYLSERQWGTVREDYSPNGDAWNYFPHDHARSRVYRWGEDGIAGISDRHCAICFSVAMWNGNDPILKERLFGLTGPEGNHGEDCKELYYYLDSTPTHSYMKHLYKYPHQAFPYEDLVETNANRGLQDLEYELPDTGIFDQNEYFDVFTEYAKAEEEDLLIKITVCNRAANPAKFSLLPTFWLRNLWSFNQMGGHHNIARGKSTAAYSSALITHPKLGEYHAYFQTPDKWLFTHNHTNYERLFGEKNETPYVKDLFHDAVINHDFSLTDAVSEGTKFSPFYQVTLEAGEEREFRLRLSKKTHTRNPLAADFEKVFSTRKAEADDFFQSLHGNLRAEDELIIRQALAGMMWTKQYYHLDMEPWLHGDPGKIPPPPERLSGRNHEWKSLNNEDIISMPDKWEYPWYAAWDLAFHCVPIAMMDPEFAKEQMILMTREWYMSPRGQIPAYEWHFSDVNPPVQAWATFQIYQQEKQKTGKGDINFLKRMVQKLGINFTWWVNRKDRNDNNVFEGGFLGLDNIGVFDRSSNIPGDGFLEQADGTAWMALFSLNMLQICLEIAREDHVYEDLATKYFEHFVYIAESLNKIGEDWVGSWDEQDGFFYDILALPKGEFIPIKVRSLVGLMTLNAVLVLDHETLRDLPSFHKHFNWFRNYRKRNNKYLVVEEVNEEEDVLLSLVPKARMVRLLEALIDDQEFLSPYGIRSMSKVHETPYAIEVDGQSFSVQYTPAESTTHMFGGNSNWRGPVWFPMNYLLIKSLDEYYKYYGDSLTLSFQGKKISILDLKDIIDNRLINIFRVDKHGDRPVNALHRDLYRDEHFKDLILFYEYFDGDNGRGIGASHQLGWTGLVANLIVDSAHHDVEREG